MGYFLMFQDSESDLEIKEVACSTRPPTKSKKKKHQVRPSNNDSESDFDIKEVRSQKQVACSSRPPTKSKKRKHQDQPSNKVSYPCYPDAPYLFNGYISIFVAKLVFL
ncbi:uncharacterized protein LOC127751690, partial [Frankliniella occidentalis]|uniref:Uncharacterized protein LOC127751690 n=1 Tax=Frankliniella occidentalis TaxID=133901 RepID=A0A9C6X9N4_FRAOC